MSGRHTILLLQPLRSKASRTFHDYESINAAMQGILSMYETKLRELNPNLRKITYDISDLYRFLDTLADISCLVFSPELRAYEPCNKDWIKAQLLRVLKRSAQ